MASANPLRTVFTTTVKTTLTKIIQVGVANGLGLTWCIDTIGKVVEEIKEEAEREASHSR